MKKNKLLSFVVVMLLSVFFVSTMQTTARCLPLPLYETNGEVYSADRLPDEIVTFIVEVEGDAVLAGEKAADLGTDYLQTDDARDMQTELLLFQDEVIDKLDDKLKAPIGIESVYTLLFNGFSVKAPYKSLEDIRKIPGVKNVCIAEDIKFTPSLYTSVGMIGATSDNSFEYTGRGQVVAVIDSEFNTKHDFFKSAPENPRYSQSDIEKLISEKTLKANAVASEAYVNAKIPFAYDYVAQSHDVYSSKNVHGSHVAGIIGGKKYDGTNLNGVAPDCQMLLMKTSNPTGGISSTAVFDAFEDAVKMGASVINCSFGMDYISVKLQEVSAWKTILQNAYNAGVFVSTAAGNSSRGFYNQKILTVNPDYSSSGSPTSFPLAMSVASADNSQGISPVISKYSAYGTNDTLTLKPDIAAPGGGIYSSVPNNTYKTMSGTSMAAPHISGTVLLMEEYISSAGLGLSGGAKVDFIKNLMMSTADVIYQKSNSVPYTPRVQGAGLVNVKNACRTPVIIKGDGTSSKLSLGELSSSTISVNLRVQNLSSSPVSYDSVSISVLTDDYTTGTDGNYYVSESKELKVVSHTFGNSISLNSKETKTINASFTLDEAELLKNMEIFSNGFFIDGFIRFKKTDSSIPDIGIPFTGFYGDWTKAAVFDSTIYDEGGSTLLNPEEKVDGTLLYSKVGSSKKDLGSNGAGGYDYKYIAISPNGDGICDELCLAITLQRTIGQLSAAIDTGAGERKINYAPQNSFKNKYKTSGISFGSFSSLSDGDYVLSLTGRYSFTKQNPTIHKLEIPFYIDTVKPQVLGAVSKGDTIDVSFSDNNHIAYVYTYYQDKNGVIHSDKKDIPNPEKGQTVTQSFDMSEILAQKASGKDIYLFVHDAAENNFCVALSDVANGLHASLESLTATKDSYSAGFDWSGKLNEGKYTFTLGFYDGNGKLIALDSLENVQVSAQGGKSTFSGNTDVTGAKKCRLYIWDSFDKLKPADVYKEFAIN